MTWHDDVLGRTAKHEVIHSYCVGDRPTGSAAVSATVSDLNWSQDYGIHTDDPAEIREMAKLLLVAADRMDAYLADRT